MKISIFKCPKRNFLRLVFILRSLAWYFSALWTKNQSTNCSKLLQNEIILDRMDRTDLGRGGEATEKPEKWQKKSCISWEIALEVSQKHVVSSGRASRMESPPSCSKPFKDSQDVDCSLSDYGINPMWVSEWGGLGQVDMIKWSALARLGLGTSDLSPRSPTV